MAGTVYSARSSGAAWSLETAIIYSKFWYLPGLYYKYLCRITRLSPGLPILTGWIQMVLPELWPVQRNHFSALSLLVRCLDQITDNAKAVFFFYTKRFHLFFLLLFPIRRFRPLLIISYLPEEFLSLVHRLDSMTVCLLSCKSLWRRIGEWFLEWG